MHGLQVREETHSTLLEIKYLCLGRLMESQDQMLCIFLV